MRPRLQLLDRKTIGRILDEALQLLQIHGVKVRAPEVVEALALPARQISDGVARIPEAVVEKALESAPGEFYLYDRAGNRAGALRWRRHPLRSWLVLLEHSGCRRR